MRVFGILDLVLLSGVAAFLSEDYGFKGAAVVAAAVLSVCFLIVNIKPSGVKSPSRRLNIMYNGRELLIIFVWSFVVNCAALIVWINFFGLGARGIAVFTAVTLVSGAVVVFNGVLRLFTTSARLGIVQRVMIALFWWVPAANVFIFAKAAKTAYNEFELETEKIQLNNIRKESEICRTRYPILMVHGVFFRDLKFFNYWGRVPGELIRNGAEVYYGEQHSAASVERCAEELKNKIEEIIRTTGCEKVNIIAHSKGGLDSRYAVSCLGMDKYVASLTTINTPHRGCEYADFILERAPKSFKNFIADRYNGTLKKFGEPDPDFISAVTDLTAKRAQELNAMMTDRPGVFAQSVGSRMKKSRSAGFPQNFSYYLVKHFSKLDNDGLVDVESMKWGERHIFFEPKTRRGISHGDMIDLMREDIKGFDIREEFVNIVSDLKARGF